MASLDENWTEFTLHPASIACLMMAAVTTFVGVHHLLLFAMRRKETLHVLFAGVCLSVASYDIFCTGVYEAVAVDEALPWQINQVRAAHGIAIFMTWFVAVFTEHKRNRVLKGMIVWFTLLLLMSFLPLPGFIPDATRPAIKHVAVPGLVSATYYEAELETLQAVAFASFVVGYVYLLVRIQKFYAGAKNQGALWIGAGQCVYFVGMVNDAFVGLQVYPFVYVSEYCFFFVVVGMFIVLLRDFVHARVAVEHSIAVLDKRVVERTRALAQAHEQTRNALEVLRVHDERLRDNIDQARVFQERILPVLPSSERVAFDVVYRPLEQVGGDIYDVCELAPARFRLFMADATGHGVQAAMRTMLLKTEYDRVKRHGADPSSVLRDLNRRLVELFPEGEAMSTAACLDIELDSSGAGCALANAAGPSLLLVRDGITREVRAEGTFLGLDHDDWPPPTRFRLEPGEVLLLFSDGLIEQGDPQRGFFSAVEALASLAPRDGRSWARALCKKLDEFRGSAAPSDDLTVVSAVLLR